MSKKELIDIQMESAELQRYSTLKDIKLDLQVIVYYDLEQKISKIINAADSCAYIFDVTAVLKSYLIDIYTLLRFKNISTIYSLELFNSVRTYDHRELIHNLTYKKTYDYTCLSESNYTKNTIIVGETLTVSESKFNQLMSAFQLLEQSRNHLEDTTANGFARLGVLFYFMMGFPILGWVVWSIITQPDGWSRIEPFTYIISAGWFLLNYLLQSIFTGKFPSFNPRDLFHVLRDWKKKQLEKSRIEVRKE